MRLKRLIAIFAATIVLTAAALAQTLPQGVQKVTSIEGVTEYAFPNGLHVLLFPDNSKPKITVNVVYLVGSRNEGYGETGMAHLLEHMVFKTTKSGRELFKELTDRTGAATSTAPPPTTRRCTSRRSTPATRICAGPWDWKPTAWSI